MRRCCSAHISSRDMRRCCPAISHLMTWGVVVQPISHLVTWGVVVQDKSRLVTWGVVVQPISHLVTRGVVVQPISHPAENRSLEFITYRPAVWGPALTSFDHISDQEAWLAGLVFVQGGNTYKLFMLRGWITACAFLWCCVCHSNQYCSGVIIECYIFTEYKW